MGHVARLLEAAGIPTVIIGIQAAWSRMTVMALPRVLITPHFMGRTLGAPGNHKRQRETILAALDLLQTARQGGAHLELPGPYRPAR